MNKHSKFKRKKTPVEGKHVEELGRKTNEFNTRESRQNLATQKQRNPEPSLEVPAPKLPAIASAPLRLDMPAVIENRPVDPQAGTATPYVPKAPKIEWSEEPDELFFRLVAELAVGEIDKDGLALAINDWLLSNAGQPIVYRTLQAQMDKYFARGRQSLQPVSDALFNAIKNFSAAMGKDSKVPRTA